MPVDPKVKKMFGSLWFVIDAIYNAVIAIDTDGIITICNLSAEKIIGKPRKDIVGYHLLDVVPESGLIDVIETGVPVLGHKMRLNDTQIYTNRTPLWDEGKIVGAIAVFQDLTEIEKISKELNDYQQLTKELEAIIEASSDGIYIADGHGYTTRVNTAYEKISGNAREDILGKNMRELEEKGLISQSCTLLALKKREKVTILQQTKHSNTTSMVTSVPYFNKQGDITMVVSNVRDMSELKHLENELAESRSISQRYQRQLKELQMQQLKFDNVVIRSSEMNKVYESLLRVAPFESTVLLQGESGVGKEVIARLIHNNSRRKEGPFIKANCGAIPENLMESELFGYEGGAFTGSRKEGKIGLFELADQGTLLLDEIGDLPLDLQVKLLRVLQDKEVKPVGATRYKKVDVRVIAATNKDLETQVSKGEFRNDLFYRLKVIPIHVPPLRERREDILALIQYFLNKLNEQYHTKKTLSPQATETLLSYQWPGNVRELENVIEHLYIMCDQERIDLDQLPQYLQERHSLIADNGDVMVNDIIPLKEAKKMVEEKLVQLALEQAGSIRGAAKLLGVNHSTLVKKQHLVKNVTGR